MADDFDPSDWRAKAPPPVLAGCKPAVGRSADLARILALPRRPPVVENSPTALALVEMMTQRWSRGPRACRCAEFDAKIRAGKRRCLSRLNYVQAWMLHEIGMVAGCFGAVGTGAGKTITGLLAPIAMPDCRVALLLLPSGTAGQLFHEYRLLREHFRVPALVMHATDPYPIQEAFGEPVLHALTFPRLSLKDSSQLIERLKPDAIFADECDAFSNPNCARTGRLMRYFREHFDTRFGCWSGSVLDDSLKDVAHLMALALRGGSPLPIDPEVVEDWCRAVDPSDWQAPIGALDAFQAYEKEPVEDALHRRLVETRGFVYTAAASVDVPITILERRAPEIPDEIEDALDVLRGDWIRPDGEELIDALSVARTARELACGFYYYWHFLNDPPESLVKEWREARRDFRRAMRRKLLNRNKWFDSEYHAVRAAMRAWGDIPAEPGMPMWREPTWPRYRDVKDRVEYESRATRLSDYLAQDAAEWGRTHRGVIWYETREFGQWVSQISGLTLHAGGKGSEAAILRETGDRSIVASVKSHGRGRDGLQRMYSDQLIVQLPASSRGCEQLLGRLRRPDHCDNRITAAFYGHTPELRSQRDQALRRSKFVKGLIGSDQHLLDGGVSGE